MNGRGFFEFLGAFGVAITATVAGYQLSQSNSETKLQIVTRSEAELKREVERLHMENSKNLTKIAELESKLAKQSSENGYTANRNRETERPPGAAPPSSTESITFPHIEKSVIEGEVFQACNVSGLFLTTLHSGQGVATLGRKHGAFFNQDNEILQDPAMMLDQPLSLSTDCSLTITGTYDVQGHSSFTMLIRRKDK